MPLAQATPLLLREPGFLFLAPLATAEPTMAALASTYDLDTWAAGWVPCGPTQEGSVFSNTQNIEPIRVAELFDAVAYSVTELTTTLAFAMTNYTLHNLRRAMNAPTGAISTVSGATVTLSSKLDPPEPEAILRCMVGWESLDHTMRMIGRQAINGGEMQSSYGKGTAAGIATVWNFERPAAAKSFSFWAAGVARLGS